MHHYIYLLALDASKLPHAEAGDAVIRTVINFVLSIAGAIALLVIAVSAFRYVLSRGNADAVKNAKNSIIYAAVGLVITMTAFAITQFVFKNVQR